MMRTFCTGDKSFIQIALVTWVLVGRCSCCVTSKKIISKAQEAAFDDIDASVSLELLWPNEEKEGRN